MDYAHARSKAGGRKTQFWYEYVFAQTVDSINQQRKENSQQVITVSNAKRLRQDMLQQLKELDVDFTDAKPGDFKNAINNVLAPENNGQQIFPNNEDGKRKYNEMFYGFAKETGFMELKGVNNENSVIPLSPYDSRFANKETFMKNGSSMLYIDADNINLDTGRFINNSNPPLYKKDRNGALNEAGDFTTQGDRSGMARLLRYIPKKDYESLADWVNNISPEQYMSKSAVDRSVAVLNYLQENGYSYEISKDQYPGQLKAKVAGTDMNIRICDTRNNDTYVGSAYDKGRRGYFALTPSQQRPKIEVTPEDSVNLIKFMLGEQVMRKDMNQPVGSYGTYQSGKFPRPNSYHTDKGGYSAVYKSVKDANGRDTFDKITMHIDNSRRNTSLQFEDKTQAEDYLRGAVKSARDTFADTVDINTLIEEAKEHAGDDGYMPQLSGDSGIAAIQQSYWLVLTGKQSDMLKQGLTIAEYTAAEKNGENTDSMFYTGNPEEKVRAHFIDMTDDMFGQYDRNTQGYRFNPANVAKYMSSGTGIYRNNDNIIDAVRKLDMNPEELKGSDYDVAQIKSRLIKFDKASAKPMCQSGNKFVQSMFDTIKTTLSGTGCDIKDKDILMDSNGIVQYTGTRMKNWRNPTQEPVKGEIGQIFVPDEMGMVETKFAGGDNYIFVPGYSAYVVPQKGNENKTLEERTRLKGYEQEMKRAIAYQIRGDLMDTGSEFGETTSINNVHHRMYDTRFPLDIKERSMKVDGMSEELFEAKIKTLSKRIRYGNEFRDESTINADFQAKRGGEFDDTANDNYANAYELSGRRNMAVMTEDAFGYFDPYATSTSTNQGIVRFLVESAEVTSDGRIIKGDENDKTPLMKVDEMRYVDYSPFDRGGQMVFNNLLTSRAVANNVNVARMTISGATMDDGKLISREWAETHLIRGEDNKLRPLQTGDKICDFGGNKGVITNVIDPDMSLDEAKELGIENEVKFFKTNKEKGVYIDIVESPFSSVSRFNASSDKMLMERPQDAYNIDGSLMKDAVGTTSYIITDMPVDVKTHVYDDDAFAAGKGRKASSQLLWALAAHDATHVMDEFYLANSTATANLRETLAVMGLDMSETGELRDHYEPHAGENRQVFEMPELEYRETKNGKYLNMTKMRQNFGNLIQNQGGIMELPFPLRYPTGDSTPPLNGDKTNVVYSREELDSFQADDKTTYGLPVMSSHLRSGQEFDDGTVSRHDYTNNYMAIYEAACKYRDEKAKGDACDEAKLKQYHNEAQRGYSQIAMDVQQRKFDGTKHNIFKDEIMAHRLPHSATAVWTADANLGINQIGMGPEMAASLDVKEGDRILTWRDPVLRGAAVSYDEVVIKDNLTGVAVNPVVAPIKDGDFDGDSIGLAKLHTKEAQREAFMKLSIESNLLNYDILNKDENGKDHYNLFIQDGLDVASAYFARPELKEQRAEIEARVNEFEADKSLSPAKLMEKRCQATEDLNNHMRDALLNECGTDYMSFENDKALLQSIERTVQHGAKGSYSKIKDYMKYAGLQADMIEENGEIVGIDYSTLTNMGCTGSSYQDAMDTMYATAVKSFGTGVAGMFSQRGTKALRDKCINAALGLTYPNTQGILQAKHDPVDAAHRYSILMTSARDLWRGHKLEKKTDSMGMAKWTVVRDKSNQPVQVTPDEFVEQFMDIYGKDGLDCDINEHYIKEVAEALTGSDGKIMNFEKTLPESASTLDKLTYGGGFAAVVEAAKNHENLFDGKYEQHIAPATIRKNRQAVAEGIEAQDENTKAVKAIVKSDVKAVEQPKIRKSDKAVTVNRRLPKTPTVSEVQDEDCMSM